MQKSIMISMTSAILSAFLIGFVTQSCKDEGKIKWEWSAPKNLGPRINSAAKDEHATFTPDGKTMIFASMREGGFGAYDLYVSRFENGGWSKAKLLPSPINTQKDDFDPYFLLRTAIIVTSIGTAIFIFPCGRVNSGVSQNPMILFL